MRSLALLILITSPLIASGQPTVCLNSGRLDLLRTQILNGSGRKDEAPDLRDEILKSARSINEHLTKPRLAGKDGEKTQTQLTEAQTAASARLCSMLNAGEWPTRAAIGEEGMNAFLYLIGRTLSIRMQLEIYPLVAASFEKGEITGSEFLAAYVDRLRVALGRKQLYGTQVTSKDGFLVQAPIERATEVDKRRERMKLVPLRQYERALEIANRIPLIRAVTEPVGNFTPRQVSSSSLTVDDSLGLEGDTPVIRLETAFVSIDVNIPDAPDGTSVALEKADFKVFDSGEPVEIETFVKTEAPFDIVLLLDLSGSTSDKVGLIKKTTRRFVEMKRPGDRVGVIAFDHSINVVSELEADQAALLNRIKKIDGEGGSSVWDAVTAGIEMLERKSEKSRRKAIVLMSDGVDNLLGFYATQSQRAGFADLVELIQNSNVTIFPIYLDTEEGGSRSAYEAARNTLAYMADQSGGTVYTAKKVNDLGDIYDRVLKGVGTVYTLGFTPDVDESSGRSWRTIKVEVPSKPALKLRHRPGYFTR